MYQKIYILYLWKGAAKCLPPCFILQNLMVTLFLGPVGISDTYEVVVVNL